MSSELRDEKKSAGQRGAKENTGQHKESHCADNDKHHVLPEVACLELLEREASIPRRMGRCVYEAIHQRAIDPCIKASQLPRGPRDAVDDAIDHTAIGAAGEAGEAEHRQHKNRMVEFVKIPTASQESAQIIATAISALYLE